MNSRELAREKNIFEICEWRFEGKTRDYAIGRKCLGDWKLAGFADLRGMS
jgi:hypothetical protein